MPKDGNTMWNGNYGKEEQARRDNYQRGKEQVAADYILGQKRPSKEEEKSYKEMVEKRKSSGQ